VAKDRDGEFRLRPRKPPVGANGREQRAYATAFKTVIHYARMSRTQTEGKRRTSSRRAFNQRCAVRVTYTGNTVRGQWKAHGRYVERDAATTVESMEGGFDQNREHCDMARLLDGWQKAGDERIWKIIVSPEFGERIDLKKLTRELLANMARQHGAALEWVAAAHFNTEHPHVHVALRAVDRDSKPLLFERGYVQHGIRATAEDLCTRQLGYRTDHDAAEAAAREVREKRYTSLDRDIGRAAQDTQAVDVLEVSVPRGSPRHHHQAARLIVLGEMGLAERVTEDVWRVRRDFEQVLRAMQRANDHQRMLAARGVLLSDERLPFMRLDWRTTTMVEGRVLAHGEEESGPNLGKGFMLLEGTDAHVYYCVHTPEMETARAQGKLRANSFARLRRLFIDGKPLLEVEDFGDAEAMLDDKRSLHVAARSLLKRRIGPPEVEWGGWVGRYQAALRNHMAHLGKTDPGQHRRKLRSSEPDR
jgi:hypothetical protein